MPPATIYIPLIACALKSPAWCTAFISVTTNTHTHTQ